MQRIGKNIFSLGASRVISGLVSFFAFIYLTRYLGKEGAGQYGVVLAYYTIFWLLSDLGIARYVIKRISEDKSRAPLLLGNFFIVQFFLSLVVLGIFVVLPRVLGFEPPLVSAMLVAGLGLFAGSLATPFLAVVQAHEQIHILAAVNFLNTLLNAAWMAAAVFWRQNLVFLFFIFAVIGLLNIAIYYHYCRKLTAAEFSLRPALIRLMLWYGVPFAFISGFEIVVAKVDVVIQKFFLPFEQIGLYSAAYRLIDALNFVPAVVAISLFPYFARQQNLADGEVRRTVDNLNRYLVALAVPMGVGGTLLAEKIILTIFREPFAWSILPFQVLIWATALTFIYAVPNIIMIVKAVRWSIYILASLMVFNAALNILLIPLYGIMASAWITVATYLLYAAAYTIFTRRLLDFSLLRYFPAPAAAAAAMGLLLHYLREWPLWPLIALGAAVYAVLLLLVKFFKREDWL